MIEREKLDRRFGRPRRITHRQDFLRIQEKGKKRRSKHFLLSYWRKHPGAQSDLPLSSQTPECRLGITVTKKIDKRAVGRNRLKRFAREIFRAERHAFRFPVDCVLIALQGASELEFQEVEREIKNLFRQEGFIRDGLRKRSKD